jgi:hypothetical protein
MSPDLSDPDVPEADAIEQAIDVDRGETIGVPDLRDEVPEADAIEQAIELPDEER